MIGLALSLSAFVSVFWLSRRSLGQGLGALLAYGYFYGIARARFQDSFSHFIFDAGLVGLYLAVLTTDRRNSDSASLASLKAWIIGLMCWPLVAALVSLAMDTGQHVLVQLIGYRAAAFMLPLVLIGGRVSPPDVEKLSSWVMWLNAIAFGFALAEYSVGIEPFFPPGPTTQIIYMSKDIGGPGGHFRIPATFGSAHAYAGTMLLTSPFLIGRFLRVSGARQWLALAVIVMSLAGVFLSGARTPIIQLLAVAILLFVTTKVPRRLLGASVVGVLVLGFVISANPRLQRFATLIEDTEYVESRIGTSVNSSFLEILVDYPLGAGLGSAGGTSVPFFLAHLARPQIGLENEYARIALEQGVIGLCLWACFLAWVLIRPPGREGGLGLVGARLSWSISLAIWGTAFIGVGVLTSIPGSALLLLHMGFVRVATRRAGASSPTSPSKPRARLRRRVVASQHHPHAWTGLR